MKKKGILALLLALIIVISQVPVETFADETITDNTNENETYVYERISEKEVEQIKMVLNSISNLCHNEDNVDQVGNVLYRIRNDVMAHLYEGLMYSSDYLVENSTDIQAAEDFRYALETFNEIRSLYHKTLTEVSYSECKDALFYLYVYGYYHVWASFGLDEDDPEKTSLFTITGEITDEGYHKITWNKLWYADKVVYAVYGAPLGKKYKKLATIDENEELSYINEVNDGKIWKYRVIPYKSVGKNGLGYDCAASTQCFLASGNSKKYTNANAISIKGDEEISLTIDHSKKIKVDLTKDSENKQLYSGKSIKSVRYYSSDYGIAEVSKKGKITGISEGSCYIYAVTENGLVDWVKVNVKPEEIPGIKHIDYSYATKEEGIDLLMSYKDYFNGFSQNDLDYKTKKKNATLDEYLEYAEKQVMDFSEEDIKIIDKTMAEVEKILAVNNIILPEMEPITFVKTSMLEEDLGAGGYTHGTEIFIGMFELAYYNYEYGPEVFLEFIVHELFHCLTRSNPEFRKDMYKIINFTVQDEEFEIPPSVMEYYISNPDVEHHNAYATFNINGEDIDCFFALIALEPFEKEGDSFFASMATAIVPIDGSDTFYLPEDTSNFYDVVGYNTGYVIDPEECMADNFKYAIIYGPDPELFPNPEIQEAILDYLSK